MQQVASSLGIDTDGKYIALETPHLQDVHLLLVGAVKVVAHPHDQVILITVTQQSVNAVIEIIVDLGHTDDTQVQQRECVGHASTALGPLVTPTAASNDAGVIGTGLVVKINRKNSGRLYLALERALKERCHKLWESDTQVGGVLAVVVVDEAAQVTR